LLCSVNAFKSTKAFGFAFISSSFRCWTMCQSLIIVDKIISIHPLPLGQQEELLCGLSQHVVNIF